MGRRSLLDQDVHPAAEFLYDMFRYARIVYGNPSTQSTREFTLRKLAVSLTVLGKMLVEILSGNLTDATLKELRSLPKEELPQPFRDMAKHAGGSAITGEELTREMLVEIQAVCEELLDTN